jgi:uncharacterized protein YgiM (DUF1202 family)
MFLPRRPGAVTRSLLVASCIGLAGVVTPAAVMAGTDPVTGTEAVVANAQGDNVRIRSGASLDADPVTKVPEGTELTIIEGPIDGANGTRWYRVDVDGTTGYMASDFVETGAAVPGDNTGAIPDGAGGTAVATDNVHLRSGPSLAYASIDKIPAGDTVTLSGTFTNGWIRITWNGFEGWADGAFFRPTGDTTPPTGETPAQPPATPTAPGAGQVEPGTRYTTESVNLRTEPALDSTIVEVIPAGVAVELTGETQDGFAKGTVNGDSGWFLLDYLSEMPGGAPVTEEPETPTPEIPAETPTPAATETPAPAPTETPAPTPTQVPTQAATEAPTQAPAETPAPQETEPAPSGSTIVWPMQGGEWYIGQGYNGSSHQNNNSLWQYEYSFDLARTDENTGGQVTYSPVTGTVRWLDPSTGGISIDVGNGMAVALFHIDIDGSITAGDRVMQGERIGTVSQPGGGGNGGWAHIHITAWATDDGGNWSRRAIPFEGVAAISGRDFPSDGSSQDWTGTIINP